MWFKSCTKNEKIISDLGLLTALWFSTATNVEIELPVTPDATKPNVRTSLGSATYAPEREALIWKIKSFPGNKVQLSSTCKFYCGVTYCKVYFNLCFVKYIGVHIEGRVQTS